MSHIRIKFTGDVQGEKPTHDNGLGGWHLLCKTPNSDGEYTACGVATPEYDTKQEVKDRGGITCKNCLDTIRYYKSIKLTSP